MRCRSSFASLCALALLSAALGTGCKVYKRKLLDPIVTAGSGAVIDAMVPPPPRPDAGSGDDDSSVPDPGTTPLDPLSCKSGECWWSSGTVDGCRSASLPLPADRPIGGDDAARIADIYLGFSQVRLGGINEKGEASEDAWEDFGFDLDGVCTNSRTCTGVTNQSSCRASSISIPYDGQLCRDNTFARLQPVIAAVPELGERFGLSEDNFNCHLWRGTYTPVLRISGYNGEQNDPLVRLDVYASTGLEEAAPWDCPSDDFRTRYPRWLASRTFGIDKSAFAGTATQTEAGKLPDSKYADPVAYVRNGYLVAHMPDDTVAGFYGDAMPYRGFVMRFQKGVYVGRLIKERDGTWSLQDGLVAGRLRKADLVRSMRDIGFCEKGDLSSFYESMLDYVEENADVLASGAVNPSADCDAMSFAIGFQAAQLTPGRPVEVPAPIECCEPGRSREDCSAVCGDGKKTGDEKCDTAIPAGQDGACPTACMPDNACTPRMLKGNECAATCEPMPITMIGARDGCCPDGANMTTDVDCRASCGNNVVEAGETCDPPESCGACAQPDNPCLVARPTGNADSCTFACTTMPVTACGASDRCCPEGCTSTNDRDCSPTCGNRRIDANETCEAGTDKPCPASCDDNVGCTVDQKTGNSSTCNVTCTHTPITRPVAGDRCCPAGAGADTDSDCQAECGNRIVEGEEQCDDGNTTTGDGCVDCKTETPQQTCMAKLSEDSECSRCTCMRCTPQTIACYAGPNADDNNRCDRLIECGRETNCSNPDCFCGSAALFSCLAGSGNGPCRQQVIDAAKTSDLLEISSRSTNTTYPLGRANALNGCVDTNCAAECDR
jgi:cysteine-rich repeat protein